MRIICDYKVLTKPKFKFYHTIIYPDILYDNECHILKG